MGRFWKSYVVNAVQDMVAMLFGWKDLWNSVPGIFLAIPYGALADKHGRRWILTLELVCADCTMLFVCMASALKFRVPRPVSNGEKQATSSCPSS